MPAINPGEVAITLGGEEFVLKSTLGAAKTVNRLLNGFRGAYERLQQSDFEAYAIIICAGAGLTTSADIEAMTQRVFDAGIIESSVGEPLTKFVALLANGGRDSSAKEPAGAGK